MASISSRVLEDGLGLVLHLGLGLDCVNLVLGPGCGLIAEISTIVVIIIIVIVYSTAGTL